MGRFACSLFAAPAFAGIADSLLPVLITGETTLHLYSVPGVIRYGGLSTFFSCTSTDTQTMQVGVELFGPGGGAPANDAAATSLTVAPAHDHREDEATFDRAPVGRYSAPCRRTDGHGTLATMIHLKGHVRGGRLLVDEPTDLPEGAEVELIAADSWDDLDDAERERLHTALAVSEDDVREGRLRSAAEVTADLRRRGS